MPIAAASQKVLYSFYARWCGTCRAFAARLQKYETKDPMPVVEIDIEEQTAFTKQMDVQGVPVLILMNHGLEIARRSGSTTYEELVEWLAEVDR
ncbi:MAG: thioredoxin family protein [Bacillus subtilis]|nr:thioredoxin family protein [Bacillus subtilis]